MNALNFTNVKHLIAADLTLHRKAITLSTILIALLLFLFAGNQPWPSGLYGFILLVGGFTLSSRTFNELGDKNKAQFYLTLPCSTLERVVSRWLLTAVGYALATLVLYFLISLLKATLAVLLFHAAFMPLNIINPWLWLMLGQYMVLQSLFFLGAATFKRFTLMKTLLSLLCFFIFLAIVTFILLISLTQGYSYDNNQFTITTVHAHFFWVLVVLMPFCWYLTYLKLSATEAR